MEESYYVIGASHTLNSAGAVLYYAGKSSRTLVTRYQLLDRIQPSLVHHYTMPEQTTVSPCCITGRTSLALLTFLPLATLHDTANLVETDIHSGNPLGSISIQHGLRTYVSLPSSADKGKAEGQVGQKQDTIILISDIFGIDLVNSKLVADEWAGQGYKVLLPDFFEGDPIPESLLQVNSLLSSPVPSLLLAACDNVTDHVMVMRQSHIE